MPSTNAMSKEPRNKFNLKQIEFENQTKSWHILSKPHGQPKHSPLGSSRWRPTRRPPQLLLLLAIYIGRALVDPPYITGPDRKSLLKPWSNSENATCSASLSRAEGRWWSISSAVFVASFCCFTPLPLCDDIYCSSFHHFRFPTLFFFFYQFFILFESSGKHRN